MKQNRVISGAVAALVLAALLAGCGSTATGASSADSTPAATEAAGSEATAPPQSPRPKLLCRTACIPPNLKPTAVWCTPTKPAMARAP